MSIPHLQLWKIARSFVRRLNKGKCSLPFDEKDVCWLRIGDTADLLGIFIPQSVYYSIEDIECHTLHELRDAGVYTDDEFDFFRKLDRVQWVEEEAWARQIKEHIDDERKAIHEQQRKSQGENEKGPPGGQSQKASKASV